VRQINNDSASGLRALANPMTRREFVGRGALVLGSLPTVYFLSGSALMALVEDSRNAPHARIQGGNISLGNSTLAAEWEISPTGLMLLHVKDLRNGQAISGPKPVFLLTLADGTQIVSSGMRLLEAPKLEELVARSHAACLSDRLPGRAVTASLEDAQRGLRATWRAILRDGSNYIRQEVQFSSLKDDLPFAQVTMLDLDVAGAEVVGSVKGSPITSGTSFFGFEHPLSQSSVEGSHLLCTLQRQLPLAHGRAASYSSVIGTTAPGQLRRDFLRYVERERAHPYRTFLHYNSWYDLGYFTPYDQAGALDVINAFGGELHTKRSVTLDSFLFDDGWDNHKSLWSFNPGFPDGFTPLKQAADKYRAAPGIWLSPWGGYDGPREERLAYGKRQGYEENSDGFVLSGPHYFKRFREVCLEMVRTYGINQFKFDGTGNASTVFPGSEFDSDFAAMISLIGDLRATKPDLYVNLTTNTYPSPFWLRYADSIWRDGDDHSFAGVGSNRQQWITYRDSMTHENVVRRGPLYPLNSLMLHGLIYARYAEKLNEDPGHDFPAEVRSYFGTGTQLQEMYITHSLLSDSDWNSLAEAAQWSRRNADILVDTHWIGGDPARLEVYGWASWSRRGGIVTLRNPDKVPHTCDLDPQSGFELPPDASQSYVARSPWRDASRSAEIELHAGKPHTFTLQPFEVLTLEAAAR
jgi:hypothetical protein